VGTSSHIRVVAALPARYASSRFPGKPLADMLGKPLIQHAHEAASQVPGVDRVVVATDDERIFKVVEEFGGEVVLTGSHHASGTDRLAELAERYPADVYVNIQGDEILREPAMLAPLIQNFRDDPALMVGTVCHPITDLADLANPNVVKVVLDHHQRALYFSRAEIPFRRERGEPFEAGCFFRHFGVYVFRRAALRAFPDLPASPLEQIEKLEQLRFLQAGYTIKVLVTEHSAWRVDTPGDLEQAVREMAESRAEKGDFMGSMGYQRGTG